MHYEKFADGSVKCIEDEIPFELPEGWVWCHYADVIELYSGQDLTPDRYNDIGEGIPYITGASNLEHGKVIINRWTTTPTTHATIGDLLLTVKGSGVGKMAFCDIIDAHIARQIMALRCTNAITPQYLYIAIAAMLSDITAQANGIIPGIRREIVLGAYLPLPPLSEQEKICKSADNSLYIIDDIDSNKADLKEIIQITKSKILDLAIRGQLVPQSPDDKPASVLLEHIRAEKEELIKQGKIKHDKKESIIFKGEDNSYYEKIGSEIRCIDGEIPFDLPDRWNWVRLKTICSKIIDGSHNPPKGSDEKTPYIMASSRNISFDTVTDLENVRYLNDKDFEKENSRSQLTINDILLTTVATLGRSCIYNGFPENLCFQRSVTVITTSILPQYLKIFFDASYFQDFIINNATGTAQKGFYLNQLESVLVCVPPAKEQNRLTTKIQQMLSGIQNIEKSLN